MPTEKEVYESHADQYERLILCEDYQKNIPAHIFKIRDPNGLEIVELGAGTGRLTRDLVHLSSKIFASDASLHMLSHARQILGKTSNNILLNVADMRQIPLPSGCVDMVIAGWSFCYLSVWGGDQWKLNVDKGLREAQRLLRPDGILILLESFGTGVETPEPPPHLVPYLDYLNTKGFQSNWFRTDYRFSSIDEADEISSFFFGDDMSQKIRKNNWTILPECTAIYWLEKTHF